MKLYDNVYAEINLDNLIHNLNLVKAFNKDQKIIAVVKDDAYGHGAVEISKILVENSVEMLAVGCVREGIELRKNGINICILIMGVTPVEYLDELLKYNLTQTITSYEYAELLTNKLRVLNEKLVVQIKLETGMGRVGLFASDENYKIVNNIFRSPFFEVDGVYSHFSNSDYPRDEYNFDQYKIFNVFCNNLEKLGLSIKYKHMCNSSGSLNFNFGYLNSIRPGLILYGYNHSEKMDVKFKPVMSLKGRIVHIKSIHKGNFIGYGKNYKTVRESRIATVNIGYGHGYPRYLSNEGKIILKDNYANIIGNICMDHFMVDVTDVNDVKIFDEVTLIGESGGKSIFADDIARIGKTICYEVLCGIRRKVQRVYIKNNQIINII